MARNNTFRNNVFISDEDASIRFPKSVDSVFEWNIVRVKGKIIFSDLKALSVFSRNVLFSAEGVVGSGFSGLAFIPEPASVLLFAAALPVLLRRDRRR